jgi:hypothetical protein
MRTTIHLPDHLFAQVKQYAARTGKTMTAVIEDSLRETLARQQQETRRPPVTLTSVSGNGLQPGVDLDDSAALLSLMEGRHDLD